jgi:hypothetical protein
MLAEETGSSSEKAGREKEKDEKARRDYIARV